MLVDSHCHLQLIDYAELAQTMDETVEIARRNNVEQLLCVATQFEQHQELCAIAAQYPEVVISVGIHPNETAPDGFSYADLLVAAKDPKVVAIGETGLDYYRSSGDMTWQHQRFREHIAVAKQVNKPLIIHTRAAKEDTLKILREEQAADVGGIFHCFTEDWDMARAGLDLNFYISFSGIVTFKNAVELQEVARQVPLDRMLIETDCPYLAPVPHRGKVNQPGYVKHVAEFIADLRGVSFAEIAACTTANYYRLVGTN